MEKLINTFKVLSDETRIRILIMLYHKKLCVCELCGVLRESQPKISKHLAKLRDMGYVKDERREQFIFYYLNSEDKLLITFLKEIVTNIKDYPVLIKDLTQLETRENFLDACKQNC
ncbi:MAG TPA: metalloregulator ArsR/SmtB family transcription factor [Clostridia bacterium]|nr:metalloregulator ArsR/SmtB family transcription factor [Clostridia bacterium]